MKPIDAPTRGSALSRAGAGAAFALLASTMAAPAGANPLTILYQGTSADAFSQGPGQGLYQPQPVTGGVILEEQGPGDGTPQIVLLTPKARNKPYSRSVIYALPAVPDRVGSLSGTLSPDKAGNLWGFSCTEGCNTASLFELVKPKASGASWTFRTALAMPSALLPYSSSQQTGYGPVIFDGAGNMYGLIGQAAVNAGCCATLFKVPASVLAGGAGTAEALYVFPGPINNAPATSGASVVGPGVVRDAHGNFYGANGGSNGLGGSYPGVVWEVSPPARGAHSYTYAVLHNFACNGGYGENTDGCFPQIPAVSSAGVLYGVSQNQGGATAACGASSGVAWSLTPPSVAGAAWTLTVLHNWFWYQLGSNNMCVPTADWGIQYPNGPTRLTKTGQMVFAVGYGGGNPTTNTHIAGGVVSVDPATGVDTIVNNAFAATTGTQGAGPYEQSWALTQDGAGNLYGVTEYYFTPAGGTSFPGVVYKIGN